MAPLDAVGFLWIAWTEAAFLGLPLVFAGFFVESKQEESLLLDRFGPAYEKYRTEVPALIPRI